MDKLKSLYDESGIRSELKINSNDRIVSHKVKNI